MAIIKQRGESWQAQVAMKNRATGQTHREGKSFATKREAEDWAQALEADLKRAKHNDTRLLDATPLSDLIHRVNSVPNTPKPLYFSMLFPCFAVQKIG